jgi:hypothetical protein
MRDGPATREKGGQGGRDGEMVKSEVRSPKSEGNPKSEGRRLKGLKTARSGGRVNSLARTSPVNSRSQGLRGRSTSRQVFASQALRGVC